MWYNIYTQKNSLAVKIVCPKVKQTKQKVVKFKLAGMTKNFDNDNLGELIWHVQIPREAEMGNTHSTELPLSKFLPSI